MESECSIQLELNSMGDTDAMLSFNNFYEHEISEVCITELLRYKMFRLREKG